MIRVGAHAVADHLGQNLRAARLRKLQFLENQDSRALADHESIAILVERPAGLGWLVVARRERAHRGESAHGQARVTAASAPPAIIASASPCRIMRTESPMELALVAHAVAVAEIGPRAP